MFKVAEQSRAAIGLIILSGFGPGREYFIPPSNIVGIV